MSNSKLVTFTDLSTHFKPRTAKIDTVSIHCMAGNAMLQSCANEFKKARVASSNYGIDSDGNIGMFVEEHNRSHCTSSSSNDNRAITIEVANSDGAPSWPISGKAYSALISLLVDICERNPGIPRLKWLGKKELIGKIDLQNMTVHRWFANKACPGDYLYMLHGDIAKEVNAILDRKNGDDMIINPEQINNMIKEHLSTIPEPAYAKSACEKAIKKGVYKDANGDGKIDNPNLPITRADLAVILDRLGLL